jgi:hypothetical protein
VLEAPALFDLMQRLLQVGAVPRNTCCGSETLCLAGPGSLALHPCFNWALAQGRQQAQRCQLHEVQCSRYIKYLRLPSQMRTAAGNWCLQAEEVVTSGYKWLRAVGRSEFTGLHTDRVFLGRGELC